RTACASVSCSACDNRSAATHCASARSSAMIRISDGPATESMSTAPNTCRLASATQALPGPTILSTRGTDAVPYANAATACAPPRGNTRSTPAARAAYSVSGLAPGVTSTSCATPATLAGTAVISTDDG